MEFEFELRPAMVSSSEIHPSRAYLRRDGERQIGIAVSGGGYRASLFGLGALMYIHESCLSRSALPRRVVAVSSVSGGSITNGLIAHGLDFGKTAIPELDSIVQVLIEHTTNSGSMFGGHAAKFYYRLVLPASGIGFLFL